MSTTTYSQILGDHGVEIPEHLEADAEVPLLTGIQRQGDLIVLPVTVARPGRLGDAVEIPADGVPVVQGEATSNTHLLVGDGLWAAGGAGTDLGVVTVSSEAYLLHPEHGAQGLAPGSYLIRRQREQADEIRLVAD